MTNTSVLSSFDDMYICLFFYLLSKCHFVYSEAAVKLNIVESMKIMFELKIAERVKRNRNKHSFQSSVRKCILLNFRGSTLHTAGTNQARRVMYANN